MVDPVTAAITWIGSALPIGAASSTIILYASQIASAMVVTATPAGSIPMQRRIEVRA